MVCKVKNQVAYVWRFRGPTWLGAHSGDSRFCDFAYLTWFWRGHFLNFAYLTWFWRGQKCDFCSGGFWGAKTNLGRLWVDFGEALARVWEVLGSSGEALRKLWEALGKLRGTTILYNNNDYKFKTPDQPLQRPHIIIIRSYNNIVI